MNFHLFLFSERRNGSILRVNQHEIDGRVIVSPNFSLRMLKMEMGELQAKKLKSSHSKLTIDGITSC